MASTQDLISGKLLERKKAVSISAITAMPALQLQYVGALTYGNYSVVSHTLTLFADDTDGATTTVLAIDTSNASYNTFGEVVDAINGTGVFRAFLIGCRREDTSTDMLDAIANTSCATTNGVTLYFEQTTASQVYGFGITNQKFLYRPTGGFATQLKGWTKDLLCENTLDYISLTMTCAAGNGTFYIYANDDVANTATLLYSEAYVDATAEAHGDTTTVNDPWVKAPQGCRLSVQFLCATAGSDFTGAVIVASGTTKSLVGDLVPGANYTGCA